MRRTGIFTTGALVFGLAALSGCEQQDDMPAVGESTMEGQTSEQQVEVEQEGVTVPGDVMTQPEGVEQPNTGEENLGQ
ncbi:hypothetical protein [Allohahella marinimesophila]|uniref:Secreted protein n=1 Tax=Allohahella marinimesophila TaxID=1054972 RepID=A0ABP7P221_9GAMM